MKSNLFAFIGYCLYSSEFVCASTDYSVNITTFDNTDPAILEGKLTVSNEIGHSVAAGDVQVTLLDHDCVQNKSSTGLEVELFNTVYSDTSEPFTYNIEVNRGLLSTSPGGFVNFTDASAGDSVGNVLFCTRVSTFSNGLQISFRESRFDLAFSLVNNTFSLTDVGVNADAQGSFNSDVEASFGVEICQCDSSFNCVTTPQVVTQDEKLVVCINPTSLSDASVVEISNFNLRFASSDGIVDYDPVEIGSTSWDPDPLTTVTPESGTGKLMISAPIVADFFLLTLDRSVDVSGNAFLLFQGSKRQAANFESFKMRVSLDPNVKQPDDEPGCLEMLFNLFF